MMPKRIRAIYSPSVRHEYKAKKIQRGLLQGLQGATAKFVCVNCGHMWESYDEQRDGVMCDSCSCDQADESLFRTLRSFYFDIIHPDGWKYVAALIISLSLFFISR